DFVAGSRAGVAGLSRARDTAGRADALGHRRLQREGVRLGRWVGAVRLTARAVGMVGCMRPAGGVVG
ncbi:hypothetical protein ABZ646_43185, partial [Streptomyces sp. NPDC007162]|uniref:hypothetical protein n=1 Tax=Streptomyces sp. NPDC007162 TaxID=3156917 RepID=UPI00340AFCD0